MCTVTYIPQPGNNYILTSNRDEQLSRNTTADLVIKSTKEYDILFPQDPLSGGTWIATSNKNRTACLLNGAFDNHQHQPPYRKSRGIVTLDLFRYSQSKSFIDSYDLDGIEPFTLVIADQQALTVFRWDGVEKHYQDIDRQKPHIWSSVTLYDEQMIKERDLWFEDWLQSAKVKNPENIMEFHHFGGQKNADYGYVMNRNNQVQTLSITSIIKEDRSATMVHKDLVNRSLSKKQIELYQQQMESH